MTRRSLLLGVLILLPRLALAEPVAPDPSASVVTIFARSASGAFVFTGSGFYAKPGLVVSLHDARRDGASIFVTEAGSDLLVPATPVPARDASSVDVFRVAKSRVSPLNLARRVASVGEAVLADVALLYARSQANGVVTSAADAVVPTVVFPRGPGGDSAGAPVLAADGTVLGLLSRAPTAKGHLYFVPASAIAARLDGKSEAAGIWPTIAPPPPPIAPPTAKVDPPPPAPPKPQVTPLPPEKTVAAKPVIQNRPRPDYTEAARTNKTQGTVVVRVLLGAQGRVKSASVVRGLPDGLNEKAIEAVYKLEFTPAKNAAGEPIDSWVSVSVSFTIRETPLTGTWVGTVEGVPGMVELVLDYGAMNERRGLVILEEQPGVFTVVYVSGTYEKGSFILKSEKAIGGCRVEWTGAATDRALTVQEFRLCGEASDPRRRTLTFAYTPVPGTPIIPPST